MGISHHVEDRSTNARSVHLFEEQPRPFMISPNSLRGGAVGFLAKLFGTDRNGPVERKIDAGQTCAKCGQPIPRENMAFDSGGGRPIHRTCPETVPEASNQ